MLRIRLSRVGKKKQPHYRVVVADIEAPRDGRIVERIGHYNPQTEPATFVIEEDRALYWLSVGAQPTESVRSLLRKQGTLQRLQRLQDGESLESLVAEYKGEEPVEPEAAEEVEVVEEPETEVGEAYAEVPEEDEQPAPFPVEEEGSITEAVAEQVSETAAEVAEDVEELVDEEE